MSKSKSRLVVRGALAILIAVLALTSQKAPVHSQAPSPVPQSPNDATKTPQQVMMTGAAADAAFSQMMGSMQSIGKSLGMADPVNEWSHQGAAMIQEGNMAMMRMSQVYKGIKV